ncbi:uncharacterized protein BJ212DRAFT_1296743 [Suillus subaureus]|uniref:Uncharacterized protein n=1 Tax=Suillus subaureus TaxID=48587 RepID=A0A9P7JHQ5_9AGAM|nr:uncharacterized protein BJ212DRAFT_1296743 [Suillus subaureus]KAG1822780.1 hypothetical protein BJ212DRAFT_1296743 [Suillus subaureus]
MWPSIPPQQCVTWVKRDTKDLLKGGLFLQFRIDQNFHCIFDGLEKNRNGKCYPNFSSKEYSPIYYKMIQIIDDTLKDEYHGPRLLAQLQEWTEAGWAENIKLNGGAAEAKHNDLQVILD